MARGLPRFPTRLERQIGPGKDERRDAAGSEQQTVPEGRRGQATTSDCEDTMKALTRGLMTIAMLAATAACDGSPTEASAFVAGDEGISTAQAPAPSGTLTFTATQSYSEATPQTASGGVGAINFTGSVTTGTPCYSVSASHANRRGVITLTVSAASTGGICTQVITNNNYTGSISGLPAGTYTFNVVHVVNGSSETAYSSPVTVQ
jgi:hypothetical protein